MHFDYFTVLVFAGVGFVFVFVNMILGSIIRPKRTTEEGLEVYECGEPTIGDAWINFDVRYYTVALVYLIFAVEIAFLFPWAIVLQGALEGTGPAADIGAFVLVEGFLFITILFLGLAYVWAKGDLSWTVAYEGEDYHPDLPSEARSAVPKLEELQRAASPEEGPDGEGGDEETDEEAA